MSTTTPPELIVSCALRATVEAGVLFVRPIDDGDHWPFGVDTVELPGARLPYTIRVWHDALAAVGDVQVTADETIAKLRIVPGASAGLDYTDVSLYRDGAGVPVETIAVPYANLWLTIHGHRP